MRYFVKTDGEIIDCLGAEHVIFAKRSKYRSLKKYLKHAIRVAIHSGEMVYQTLQPKLSDKQKKSLSRLYREYHCSVVKGAIGDKILPTITGKKRISFRR